ncbi:MAG: hypothetical protein L0Y76_08455 [Ignavibacteria bacterium]|nr:hypothetical protein [Ignavibacteria bacterium]
MDMIINKHIFVIVGSLLKICHLDIEYHVLLSQVRRGGRPTHCGNKAKIDLKIPGLTARDRNISALNSVRVKYLRKRNFCITLSE